MLGVHSEAGIPLPVKEWLVATEPSPCSVKRIVGTDIRVHRVRSVVRIEALDAVLVFPVAISLAGWLVSLVVDL